MIIPINVPDCLHAGEDLLKDVPFAGNCRAIVEDDEKTVTVSDERLCPIC